MAKHRTYSLEFKRQIAQEYLGDETLTPADNLNRPAYCLRWP